MGHGKKNQSRHSQIVINNERIATLGKAIKGMAELSGKEEAERNERNTIVDETIEAILDRVISLEAAVEFNALPFWKRWSRTWKAAREVTKNSHRPQIIEPLPKEIVEQIENSVEGQAESVEPLTDDDTKPLPEAFVDKMVGEPSRCQEDVKGGHPEGGG